MAMKIDQVGLSPGVPGQARRDGLSTGAVVTLTDTQAGGSSLFEILWVDPADTTTVASLAIAGIDDHVWTFTPTIGVTGPIRIVLIHTAPNGLLTFEYRIFGIPDGLGAVPPAPGEQAATGATLLNAEDSAVIAASERNWPLADFPLGNPFGWAFDAIPPPPAPTPAMSGAKFFKEVPDSPHADDVEFTTALVGWDCRVYNSGTGLGQAMTLGSAAVDPRAALSQGVGNVNVNTQRASWLHLQSWPTNVANNGYPAVYCKTMAAPVTNMFVWARLGTLLSFAGTYDPNEQFRLVMCADASAHPAPHNWVGVGLSSFAGTRVFQGTTCIANNQTPIPNSANPVVNQGTTPYEYFGIHKRGTAYDFWCWTEGLNRMYLGSLTTSMTLAWLGFQWALSNNASSPGVPIHCSDFIRRLDNVTTFPF